MVTLAPDVRWERVRRLVTVDAVPSRGARTTVRDSYAFRRIMYLPKLVASPQHRAGRRASPLLAGAMRQELLFLCFLDQKGGRLLEYVALLRQVGELLMQLVENFRIDEGGSLRVHCAALRLR